MFQRFFLHDCLNKAGNVQPPSEMSDKDKANACKDMSDKPGN